MEQTTSEELFEEMFARHPELSVCRAETDSAYRALEKAYASGGKLLVCGNGGSAADADHIVGELMKGFRLRRPLTEQDRVPFSKYPELTAHLQKTLTAIALTQHTALSTAFGNDVDPSMIFAQQVYGYGRKGDCFLGITTSGNSVNVMNAALTAKAMGLTVIGLTGAKGGKLKETADICICVPETDTAFVQEKHIIVYHTLCGMLEAHFFGDEGI